MPPPTMPAFPRCPADASPPPTMPPPTMPPPNTDAEIQALIDKLEQFGDGFPGLIDALRDLQSQF